MDHDGVRPPEGTVERRGGPPARRLGEPEPPNSRSVASIVAANSLTLFNAIIGVFFILILSLGLWADALFGFIAIVNSYIGIRQELKAKETLDQLALLVAPRAQAIRDGAPVDLRADEVVPGDVVRIEPGDQLVADGEVIQSRGLTLDESMLTGESDGIRKQTRDRVLSGSFCLSGSGYYEVDAVREESHAEKVAGEARTFRHPPSPLQEEVNRVIWATTVVHGAARHSRPARAERPRHAVRGGGPDRDRRPDHADPRGPRPADERHPGRGRRPARPPEHAGPADGRDRGARRGRHDLRRQDRHARPTASSSWSRSRPPTAARSRPRSARWRGSRTRRASATARCR